MSTANSDGFFRLAKQLHDQYQTLDKFVEQIVSKKSTATTEHIEQINQYLELIKNTESELAPLRDQHAATGQPLPENVKPFVNQTIEYVITLIPRIAALEQAAVKAREQLAPVIHSSVRALDMQNAYGRSF